MEKSLKDLAQKKTTRLKKATTQVVAKRAAKRAAKKAAKKPRIKLHKSFRRSYREDYVRDLKAPGLFQHAVNTFRLIFQNWRLFVPLVILIVFLNTIFIGLLSEDTYTTFQETINETNEEVSSGQIGNFGRAALTLIGTISTGGLNHDMDDTQQVLLIFFGLVTWLVTIYLVRQLIAGHKPKLRDGLYTALAPIISTLAIVAVIFLEALPIMIVVITYSAAISTDFLSTPFYALVYFIFAALMVLLSVYLISSSFLALIAVTAPGLYPLAALNTATDLVAGRRVRLIVRILFAFVVLAFCWVVVMMPVIIADFWFKSWVEWLEGVPIVPFFLSIMTVFSFIYFSAYSYLFYRQLLDYNDK